jgi:cytochrome c551/c552
MSEIELRSRDMRQVSAACLLVLLSGLACAAQLSDTEAKQFFNAKGCNACHGVDDARIGPPFRAVAARYWRSSDALENLGRKIRFGGAGSWGLVPMISYPGLSDEEIQAITRWILSLKSTDASVNGSRSP